MLHRLVEVIAERELEEEVREVPVDLLVEAFAKEQKPQGGRKGREGSIEGMPKTEVGEEGRK